jgi:hypothetical protein
MAFVTMSIFAMSIYLSSLTTNYYSFLVLYAAVPGTMVGLGMTIPHYCVWQYYPEQSQFYGNVFLVANFMAPLVPNLIIHYVCNPDNIRIEYDREKARMVVQRDVFERVPFTLRVLAVYYGVLGIIGSLMISAPKRTLQNDIFFMKME